MTLKLVPYQWKLFIEHNRGSARLQFNIEFFFVARWPFLIPLFIFWLFGISLRALRLFKIVLSLRIVSWYIFSLLMAFSFCFSWRLFRKIFTVNFLVNFDYIVLFFLLSHLALFWFFVVLFFLWSQFIIFFFLIIPFPELTFLNLRAIHSYFLKRCSKIRCNFFLCRL